MGDTKSRDSGETREQAGGADNQKIGRAEHANQNDKVTMHKRVTKKEDGRSLIYYTFSEAE